MLCYTVLLQDGPSCKFSRAAVGATCTGFVDLPFGDEEKLKEVVATVGPVSVAINAMMDSFHLYSGGSKHHCSVISSVSILFHRWKARLGFNSRTRALSWMTHPSNLSESANGAPSWAAVDVSVQPWIDEDWRVVCWTAGVTHYAMSVNCKTALQYGNCVTMTPIVPKR